MSFSNTSLSSLTSQIWDQLRSNPVNWVLAGLCIYMVRAYFQRTPPTVPPPKQHRPRVFETFVPKTLVKYNGRHDPNLPIYLAIKGKVYDVTPGRTFYGPGKYCFYMRRAVMWVWCQRSIHMYLQTSAFVK
jgi:hypothetical protein